MNEERLNKLLEDINDALCDFKNNKCNVNVTTKGHKWETYYGLDNDLIGYIRKIENSNKNLQSKIDKAIEYIENNLLPSHDVEKTDWEFEEVIFSDLPVERIKPLIDILKEQYHGN